MGEISLAALKPLLGEINEESNTLDGLQGMVCQQFNLAPKDLASRSRTKELSRARQVYMFLARKCGYGVADIGRSLGRDHTTVLSGLQKVASDMEKDGALKLVVERLGERVGCPSDG